jgi:hypothetical protein
MLVRLQWGISNFALFIALLNDFAYYCSSFIITWALKDPIPTAVERPRSNPTSRPITSYRRQWKWWSSSHRPRRVFVDCKIKSKSRSWPRLTEIYSLQPERIRTVSPSWLRIKYWFTLNTFLQRMLAKLQHLPFLGCSFLHNSMPTSIFRIICLSSFRKYLKEKRTDSGAEIGRRRQLKH